MFSPPDLSPEAFDRVRDLVRRHWDELHDLSIAPTVDPRRLRLQLRERFDFEQPVGALELVNDVASMLRETGLQSTHRRYFGLFNPPALPVTTLADALVAGFNPQLAVWAHSPAAHLIEQHTLEFLRARIGMPEGTAAHFTSGGQEANATAMAAALGAAFPRVPDEGVRALPGAPVLYVSEQGHHSFQKVARQSGLGESAVRTVAVDERFRMAPEALRAAIVQDRRSGRLPFLAVGTAGTTGTGAIDPLPEIASVCRQEELWFHVDAAWGGTALLSPGLAPALDGIERADSVTWDAHKWLSVPVGAGMSFVRRPESLARMFHVDTGYVPPPSGELPAEPYVGTAQWSRRFIGLKLFMALAWLGADGYRALVDSMAATGERLRERLVDAGWELVNETPLPLVCTRRPEMGPDAVADIARRLQEGGRVWVSSVALPDGGAAIRACITSYATTDADLRVLVEELEAAAR